MAKQCRRVWQWTADCSTGTLSFLFSRNDLRLLRLGYSLGWSPQGFLRSLPTPLGPLLRVYEKGLEEGSLLGAGPLSVPTGTANLLPPFGFPRTSTNFPLDPGS